MKTELSFVVYGQTLSRIDNNKVLGNTNNVYMCHFDVPDEWADLILGATFKRDRFTYNVLLDENNYCGIPTEVLRDYNNTSFEIALYGIDSDATLTTTICEIPVIQGTPFFSASALITPSIFEQIMQKISEISHEQVNPEIVSEVVEQYLVEHPIEAVTEEVAEQIVNDYVTTHKEELKGDKGDTGAQGIQGEKGDKGDKGDNGTNGKSAYQIAVDNGFVGTEEQWLASLKGDKGEKGDSGEGSSYDDTEIKAEINDARKARDEIKDVIHTNLIHIDKNLFDPSTVNVDKSLSTKGALNNTQGTNTSDYIDISNVDNPCFAVETKVGRTGYRFCFYDSAKVNLSGTMKTLDISAGNENVLYPIEPPEGATYLRFHYSATNSDKQYVGDYVEDYSYFSDEIKTILPSTETIEARGDYPTLGDRLNSISVNAPKRLELWGDSLTQGNQDSSGVDRASVLQSLLGNDWTVKNYGVGGEKANAITARANGMLCYVNNITIPADTTAIDVTNELVDVFGESVVFGNAIYNSQYNGWENVNPCYIDGIECTLKKTGQNQPIMLNRVTAGEAHSITRPTAIMLNSDTLEKGGVLIICIGQNRGFDDSADVLIGMIDGIIEARKSDRYIVVGMVRALGEDTWQAPFNERLKAKYGKHYLDIEAYMKTIIYDNGAISTTYGLADNNLTPTAEDLAKIEIDKYPPALLAPDGLHFNQYGYTCWANREYLLGKWLGYWGG